MPEYRGSIEGGKNLASLWETHAKKIVPHSALPLKCMIVKKLTGSGRYFGSATKSSSQHSAISIQPSKTATAKPLPLIHGQPGQVYADEADLEPREWLLGRYQARQYRRKHASNCRYRNGKSNGKSKSNPFSPQINTE